MTKYGAMDRRNFLKLGGCLGLGAALPLISPAIGLASLDRELKVAQDTRMLMGTWVSVTAVDASGQRAQDALEAAFSRMTSLAPLFDRHGRTGQVAMLNHEGRLSDPTPELRGVLDFAERMRQVSQGSFDITVAPVVDTMKASFEHGNAPSLADLRPALSAVGAMRRTTNGGVELTAQGAGITLDGVAKGYIADMGLRALRQAGVTRGLINAGGDVALMGSRADGKPWRVAVADPKNPAQAKTVVEMTSGALATSGNYEVYFDEQRLYHHIVNPRTGRSPRSDLSVSVKAESAGLADALATACFVMHPSQAHRFLKAMPKVEGLILTRLGQRYQTPGFQPA